TTARLLVLIKKSLDIFLSYANARFCDVDANAPVLALCFEGNLSAFRRELYCVREKIDDDAAQLRTVGVNRRQVGRERFFQKYAFLFRQWLHCFAQFV